MPSEQTPSENFLEDLDFTEQDCSDILAEMTDMWSHEYEALSS